MNRDAIRPQERGTSGLRSEVPSNEQEPRSARGQVSLSRETHEDLPKAACDRSYYRLLQSSTTDRSVTFVPCLDAELECRKHAAVPHLVTLSDMLLVYYRRGVDALRRKRMSKATIADRLTMKLQNLDFQLRGDRQEIRPKDVDAIARLVGHTGRGLALALADIADELEQVGEAFRGDISALAEDQIQQRPSDESRGQQAVGRSKRVSEAAAKRGARRGDAQEERPAPASPRPRDPQRPERNRDD
jgi:hypothetical protein